MKAALVQFDPLFKDPVRNKLKISQILSAADMSEVELVMLPEMALTGYCFNDKSDILEYCEALDGETFKWASSLATTYNVFVQVGYPRKDGNKLYNSLLFIAKDGSLLLNYDKHFLYKQDEYWAEEGLSFLTAQLLLHKNVNVGFGICMDLSPYQFKSPFEDFEFGSYQVQHHCDLVLCSMAWLLPADTRKDAETDPTDTPKDVEMDMMNYWALRLKPLIEKSGERPVTVLICNRIGTEKETVFGGTSCCLRFERGKAKLVGNLKCGEEGCLVVDIDV
jgi:protein N-terminal amidase